MLVKEASMYDGSLLDGPSRRGACAQGGGRDQPRDRGGVEDQSFVRLHVGDAQALGGLGAINGAFFRLYIEKVLAPTLSPGDVIVLDNIGSHKGKAPRAAVRACDAHLPFLPRYSPDLNPIEQVFAKPKHLMRSAQPRDVEATWSKAGQPLDHFSPTDCANCLAISGYGSA
jgi:transposase